MTIEEALATIMGADLAADIINDMGIHWAVVAAMAQATTDDDPTALQVIRDYSDDAKAEGRTP